VGERDYHYGVAPQGLVGLRLILGDRAMLDLTGRAYHLTGMGGADPGGRETIERLNMGFTVRVYGRHALGLNYIASVRDAQYPDRADSHQSIGTITSGAALTIYDGSILWFEGVSGILMESGEERDAQTRDRPPGNQIVRFAGTPDSPQLPPQYIEVPPNIEANRSFFNFSTVPFV